MILTLCIHVSNNCRSSESGTLVGTGWDPLSSLFFMPDNVTQTPDTNKAAQARRLSEQSAYCAARSYLKNCTPTTRIPYYGGSLKCALSNIVCLNLGICINFGAK